MFIDAMEKISDVQSDNEKFEEIYRKLDEMLPDEDLSGDAETEKHEKEGN